MILWSSSENLESPISRVLINNKFFNLI